MLCALLQESRTAKPCINRSKCEPSSADETWWPLTLVFCSADQESGGSISPSRWGDLPAIFLLASCRRGGGLRTRPLSGKPHLIHHCGSSAWYACTCHVRALTLCLALCSSRTHGGLPKAMELVIVHERLSKSLPPLALNLRTLLLIEALMICCARP